jgi:hypothetical protein
MYRLLSWLVIGLRAMNKIDTSTTWAPDVLGRMKLDERRWAYGITAPFDMAPHIPDLMETKVSLDGKLFKIRGIVPSAPFAPIKAGEFVEILVVAL